MSNSIGNLKNSGLQGNNFPWQLKMLQGLQAIYDEVKLPLTCAEDSIRLCDGQGHSLDIQANGSINVNVLGSIPVSLDCNDSITICNSSFTNDGVSSLNVHVTNPLPLEVNINEANDSILIYGFDGTTNRKIKTDAAGELQVDILTMPATFAEDTAHVSGNTGAFVLGVRNDLNTVMTNADGDYSPIAVNDKGAVAVQDGGGSLTVDALNLDIRNLSHLVDTVKIYGSNNANPVSTDVAGNIGIWDGNNSITVDGGTGSLRTTGMIRPAGGSATDLNLTVPAFYSVSVANVGSNNGTVLGATIKPGEVLNFSADAINNYFNSFAYNASGTEFIIIFVY